MSHTRGAYPLGWFQSLAVWERSLGDSLACLIGKSLTMFGYPKLKDRLPAHYCSPLCYPIKVVL